MYFQRIVYGLVFIVLSSSLAAQNMAEKSFAFLDIPFGARLAGLGGTTLAIRDKDLSIAMANPSLLDSAHHNKAILGYSNYFADINFGSAAYSYSYKDWGHFMASVKYMNYGTFKETDYIGNEIGTFTANDYNLGLTWAKKVDTSVYIGASLNFLSSVYDDYKSSGLYANLAATYQKPGTNFVGTVMLKNAGYQLTSYTEGTRSKLPFDLMMALSYKLKHAPFRFHFAFDKLLKWDLSYLDPTVEPEIDPTTGLEIPVKEPGFFNKAMRHVTSGAEILLGKSFYLDIGFNFRRREELKYTGKTGIAGFNFGTGFFLKKMAFALSFSKYHLAGNNVQLLVGYSF